MTMDVLPATTPRRVDLLVRSRWLLPMTDEVVIDDGLVAVDDGRIVYVGPAAAADRRGWPAASRTSA